MLHPTLAAEPTFPIAHMQCKDAKLQHMRSRTHHIAATFTFLHLSLQAMHASAVLEHGTVPRIVLPTSTAGRAQPGRQYKSDCAMHMWQELGPRFTMKLLSLQRGTFDSKTGEYSGSSPPSRPGIGLSSRSDPGLPFAPLKGRAAL